MSATLRSSTDRRVKPSFFIVGAPRCGTTALYEYLNSHPSLFLPTLKEPHFFATDLPGYRYISTEDEYLSLFSPAGEGVIRAGEASVLYLSSAEAVRNILEYDADARMIVLVRNPVEMFESLHAILCNAFFEDQPDGETAWHLQEERQTGRSIPPLCREPALLNYKNLCSLGTQVERLLKRAAPEQVKIVVFDDLVKSPRSVYEEVIAFLGVPSDGKTDFPRVNARQHHRLAWLARALQSPPSGLFRIREWLKYEYYVKRSLVGRAAYGTALAIKSSNAIAPRARQLPPAFRGWLSQKLQPEVERLEGILGRRFPQWRSPV